MQTVPSQDPTNSNWPVTRPHKFKFARHKAPQIQIGPSQPPKNVNEPVRRSQKCKRTRHKVPDPVGTRWGLSGDHLVSTWSPPGPHLVPSWSPPGSLLVLMWSPRVPTWFPPGPLLVPTRFPPGNQVGTKWESEKHTKLKTTPDVHLVLADLKSKETFWRTSVVKNPVGGPQYTKLTRSLRKAYTGFRFC